jgi:ABC-type histidine transport system ATPase subunit
MVAAILPSASAMLPEDHIFVDDVRKSFGPTKVLRGITMHASRRR